MSMKKNVKDTIGLGVGSMGGLYAMGSLSSLPGMPAEAKGVSAIASSGVQLANIGQLGKTAMGLTDPFQEKSSKKKKMSWL